MHQYLFFVGDFPIRAYGLILSLSIILATGVAYFLAKQDGRWHNHIVDIGIYSGIAGIVGARLWDVFFFDWAYYSHHLSEIFYVWQGGMAIQGGIVFGVGAGIIYARRHKIDILALADIVAPAIILGQAIGRCANLLNGDAFGAPTGKENELAQLVKDCVPSMEMMRMVSSGTEATMSAIRAARGFTGRD